MASCEACGRDMNPAEAMLGPVCGRCARQRHAAAVAGVSDPLIGEWLKRGWIPRPGHRVRTPHGTEGIVLEVQGSGSQASSQRRLRVYVVGGGAVWLRGPVWIWAVGGGPVRLPVPRATGPVVAVAPFRFEALTERETREGVP